MTEQGQETVTEAPAQNHESYDTYEPVESELLDVVPSHWNLSLIKRHFEVQVGKMLQTSQESPSEVELPYLKARHIHENGGITTDDLPTMWFDADDRAKYSLQSGDVLVAEGGDVGQAVVWKGSDREILYQNAINRLRSRGNDSPHFLYYWITWLKNQGYIEILCNNATILHYTAETVANTPLLIPTPDEQQAVSDFLDDRTARIDALIAKKKRFLNLLNERRRVFITRAITAGFGSTTATKSTEIEWLGEIPVSWDTVKVAYLSHSLHNGHVGPTKDILASEGTRYIQSLHIDDNRIIFDPPYYVDSEWAENSSKSEIHHNDVLVVQTGDIGQVAVVPEELDGAHCHALIIISPNESLLTGPYLAWVLNSTYGFNKLKQLETGALHPHLNCTDVREIRIPLPPVEEQKSISEDLNEYVSEIESLKSKIERSIDLLEEKRQALITAAVTGQIDVTGPHGEIHEQST